MPDEYLETKGELLPDAHPRKKKKKHRFLETLVSILCVVIITGTVVITANIAYLKLAYGSPFAVDGTSMYPTLNKDALSKQSDGSYTKVTWRSGSQKPGDIVDYGWSKLNIDLKTELNRFDVVVTYFADDMEKQSDGTYKEKKDALSKIKRLVAFPGETIQITPDKDENGEFLTPWGTMTITSAAGEVSVYPSYYTFDDYEDVNGVSYKSMLTDANQTFGPYTLAENEYFVLGDNRASRFSNDSRLSENKVYDYCIEGKACLITAKREITETANGYDAKFLLNQLRPFWNYQNLDGSAIEKTKKVVSNA